MQSSYELKPRWIYTNPDGLVKWYGHVDYYGPYVLGQWFALHADTGKELWSTHFRRANTLRGYANGVIIASETRSDGPWTIDFGIYGIDAKTGQLLWTNHGRGWIGKIFKWLDHIPGYTNEFRDAPKAITSKGVSTRRKRTINLTTGEEIASTEADPEPPERSPTRDLQFYTQKSLKMDGDTLHVDGTGADFHISRRNSDLCQLWEFRASDIQHYVGGNFNTYRLLGNVICILLGNAPAYVPINSDKPSIVRTNTADYGLGILDIESGAFKLYMLPHGRQSSGCRIEAIKGRRILISSNGKDLAEFEIPE